MAGPDDSMSVRTQYTVGVALMLSAFVVHLTRGNFSGWLPLLIGVVAWTMLAAGAFMVGTASHRRRSGGR